VSDQLLERSRSRTRAAVGAPLDGGGMARPRRHPLALAAVALAVAAGAVVAIAANVGFGPVSRVLGDIQPAWLALVFGAQVVGVLAYTFTYRVVATLDAGPKIPFGLTLRLVAAGFGAFTAGGGFGLDYEAWKLAGHGRRGARVRVLGLGAIEYAVLAPAASVAAIVLLVTGSHAMPSLLWPWAVAVPLGFAGAFWALGRRSRLTDGGRRRPLDEMLHAIEVLRRLVVAPSICVEVVLGMAAYWTAEIASLWAALMAFGTHLSVGALIVAYATGYAATRRTLPLGGAGTTEALMTYALHWVGVDVAHALAAVIVYRFFNFALATIPALYARRAIEPLFRDGDGAGPPHEALARLVV
jgi:uncharacterized membrane protein YbhN (UPF0104 family)